MRSPQTNMRLHRTGIEHRYVMKIEMGVVPFQPISLQRESVSDCHWLVVFNVSFVFAQQKWNIINYCLLLLQIKSLISDIVFLSLNFLFKVEFKLLKASLDLLHSFKIWLFIVGVCSFFCDEWGLRSPPRSICVGLRMSFIWGFVIPKFVVVFNLFDFNVFLTQLRRFIDSRSLQRNF